MNIIFVDGKAHHNIKPKIRLKIDTSDEVNINSICKNYLFHNMSRIPFPVRLYIETCPLIYRFTFYMAFPHIDSKSKFKLSFYFFIIEKDTQEILFRTNDFIEYTEHVNKILNSCIKKRHAVARDFFYTNSLHKKSKLGVFLQKINTVHLDSLDTQIPIYELGENIPVSIFETTILHSSEEEVQITTEKLRQYKRNVKILKSYEYKNLCNIVLFRILERMYFPRLVKASPGPSNPGESCVCTYYRILDREHAVYINVNEDENIKINAEYLHGFISHIFEYFDDFETLDKWTKAIFYCLFNIEMTKYICNMPLENDDLKRQREIT